MTIQHYTIETSPDQVTWTAVANVQEINARIGRTGLQDIFEPSGCTFTVRYPNGYTTPNSAFNVGTYVKLSRVGYVYEMWQGQIRNVTASWGKPFDYSTNTGNADYVTIECEGFLAQWGRLQGNGQVITSGNGYNQLAQITSSSGISLGTSFSTTDTKILAGSTVSGSYAEWLNTFANSLVATITDGANQVGVYPNNTLSSLNVNFSDAANNVSNQVYDELAFDSLAANYYTAVEVNTNSYGTIVQTVGAAPYRTLRISTFNGSAAQATDLANYYLGVYQTPSFGVSSISCKAEAQNNMNLDMEIGWWNLPGNRCKLTFRNVVYSLQILGANFTATPESARYTYSVVDADLTPYLYLDSTFYGILGGTGIIYNTPMDYNEAGYIYNDDYADNGNRLGF